jgi:RNAse (barnase) inhibitor barstar
MKRVLVNQLMGVDEVFELGFLYYSGEKVEVVRDLQFIFDFPGKREARNILNGSADFIYSGSYFECMVKVSESRKIGVFFEIIQTKVSPWSHLAEEDVENIIFFSGWSDLTVKEKYQWLNTVRMHFCSGTHPKQESNICYKSNSINSYRIDGKNITDKPSFYLALGEAVNGPAGYFGGCLNSLDDCLSGGFGWREGFYLEWLNSDICRTSLGACYFSEIVNVFGSWLRLK